MDASSLRKHMLTHGERHVKIKYFIKKLSSIFVNMKDVEKNSLIIQN